MRKIYNSTNYVMCPHTAVGHLAMEAFADGVDMDFTRVTVGTAHPAKFADSVERILRTEIDMPPPLAKAMGKKKRVHVMKPGLEALTDYLAIHA